MKNIEFTSIFIENFGRHRKPIQSKLGHRVLILGANEVGKSTLKRSVQWILGSRDENGKEITGIRPHDENGVDIDGLTTTAELIVSVDGQENTLKRTCFQEKNRHGEYTGRDNLQYFIDDVKKGTKKAYDEFVSSFLPSMVCISAQEFLSKDTAGRRAMLEVFSEHDTDSIIDENAEFEPIRAKLKANSVADLKKACRDKIKKQEKERDSFPARIDEIEKQKVDIDVAELELQRNALKEQIAENKAKQEDISKQFAEFDKQSKDILDLRFELNDLQRKANEELVKQKRELQEQIDKKNDYLLNISNGIQRNNREIAGYEQDIESGERERQRLLEQWNNVKSEEFDENTAICPTCHRELPQNERERLLSGFEKSKAERIAEIEKKGLEVKQDIDNAKDMIPKLQECDKDNLANKERLEKEVADLEKQLSELPSIIDISDREDVKAIKQQIAEKEQAMSKGNSADEIRKQLQEEYNRLLDQIGEVEVSLSLAQKNVEIDERISDLRSQQRKLSQDIADIEKELSLLCDFEREKARLLEEDLNKNCQYIRFKLSELQQNGELKDICKIMVGGEDYDRNLNHGAKILAQIDICLIFQRLYNVCLPIIADDCESLDEWRIPKIENQIILIRRTDDKEMKIETIV